MDIWRSVGLGIIQGLTEFLPVSSSGHLVLAEHLLGVDPPGITFEVIVHFGTLLAVLVYFRKRLLGILRDIVRPKTATNSRQGWRYLLAIGIGTIPAGIAGLFLKNQIETAFSSPKAAAGFLIVTGVILFATLLGRRMDRSPGAGRAFLIGCAQAAALLPGISRSGATISTAVLLGLSPAVAAEFSFILSIPAILGATVLSLGEAFAVGVDVPALGVYAAGGLAALAVGYASLRMLFGMIRKGRFWWFGVYCLSVGVAGSMLLP